MRKHLTLGLILSSAMALTSVAMAAGPEGHQGGHEHGRSGHGHHVAMVMTWPSRSST